MKKISVMGILEPLMKISELLNLRKELKEYLSAEEPDIFIDMFAGSACVARWV